jgi:hypothetical protein
VVDVVDTTVLVVVVVTSTDAVPPPPPTSEAARTMSEITATPPSSRPDTIHFVDVGVSDTCTFSLDRS